ncbi:hypothetical protein BD310DRAFT_916786 [Dichomitus squalens]|uniref:Uncharacterized protein n=1 Tax=Dichomitus squalens TaxID=114155 RepID=A0A4Q9Q7X0_9APHY|nr:hypothetical protein BD310DRAFT_916786 [Dichomitus squalens]
MTVQVSPSSLYDRPMSRNGPGTGWQADMAGFRPPKGHFGARKVVGFFLAPIH